MKRTAIGFLLLAVLVFSTTADAQRPRGGRRPAPPAEGGKKPIACPSPLNDINNCPDTGCGGSLDPLLNTQKNTAQGDPKNAKDITFADFAKLPATVEGYKGIGFDRARCS